VLVTCGPHPSGQLASYNLNPFHYSAVAPAYAIIIHYSRVGPVARFLFQPWFFIKACCKGFIVGLGQSLFRSIILF
jgi:hypothetical protein